MLAISLHVVLIVYRSGPMGWLILHFLHNFDKLCSFLSFSSPLFISTTTFPLSQEKMCNLMIYFQIEQRLFILEQLFEFPTDENTSDILKHISKIIGDYQNVEDPPGKQAIIRVGVYGLIFHCSWMMFILFLMDFLCCFVGLKNKLCL